MRSYRFQLVSPLAKVFPKGEHGSLEEFDGKISSLLEEPASFQIAYYCGISSGSPEENLHFDVDAGEGVRVRIRKIELVPGAYVCTERYDDDYLTKEPGLFPDLLSPVPENGVHAIHHQWRSVWVDLIPDENCAPGPRTVTVSARTDDVCWQTSLEYLIVGERLPPQKTIHTEWFHTDCLADYYRVPVFSEEHWTIVENFVRTAAENGMNMLLTPVFTPPLDTAVGGERTTVQLVDVARTGDQWTFGFDKLRRWIDMAQRCGICYFEISHLFTQWGVQHAPKVMALVDGREKQVFGWETQACGPEYVDFLHQFLPQLTACLTEKGVADRTWFHISDEPQACHLDFYRAARDVVADCLKDFPIIDALSDFELYGKGVVKKPIVSNDHMEAFLQAQIPGLWTYYCVSQSVDVSNRFLAMPLARCRILGVQLYLYKIEGFLHWGYNFYNTQYSVSHVNPFAVTDAGESFPAGDSFIVYPGQDGRPQESTRLLVLAQAFRDVRALELLESMTDRAYVEGIIREEAGMRITFRQYPRHARFLLRLRERINREIAERCS